LLLPVLAALLDVFPFVILGLHSDNGPESINARVAALLDKLHAEFAKSRSCRTNDNALAESKNGSVVRKHLGYGHIPGRFAQQVNDFAQGVLSPYLNIPPPLLLPHRGDRRQGPAAQALPLRDDDPLREAQIAP
jgi:hypothetical protein